MLTNVVTRVMETITAAAIAATSQMVTIIAVATVDTRVMEAITVRAKMVAIRRRRGQAVLLSRRAVISQMETTTAALTADTKVMANTIVVTTADTKVTVKIIARESDASGLRVSAPNLAVKRDCAKKINGVRLD